jgi:hypothetical protein
VGVIDNLAERIVIEKESYGKRMFGRRVNRSILVPLIVSEND